MGRLPSPTQHVRLSTELYDQIKVIQIETRATSEREIVDRLIKYALNHVHLRDAQCKDMIFDGDN